MITINFFLKAVFLNRIFLPIKPKITVFILSPNPNPKFITLSKSILDSLTPVGNLGKKKPGKKRVEME